MKTAVEERRVIVDGLSIRYFTSGNYEPPLVLLHGDGESAIDWSWVIPGLAVNHCVYALDLPGSGDSAKPNREYSPEFFAQFVGSFLDAMGIERAILVGNSLGGLIALRLALSHPEKVAALVLVDSSGLGQVVNPILSHLTVPLYGELAILACKTSMSAKLRAWARASLLFAHPSQVPEGWIAEQERLAMLPGFLEANLSSLRTQLNMFGQYKVLLDSLEQLQMPTLVVWGTEDLIFPVAQAKDAFSRLQKGQLALISDCGHIPQIERPKEFTEVVSQFLADISDQ